MKELLKRFGIGKEVEVKEDYASEALQSFYLCQSDTYLAQAFFQRAHSLTKEAFLDTMQALLQVHPHSIHSVQEELKLLNTCLSNYKQVFDKEVYIDYQEKGNSALNLPALILFPIVLNALQLGYNGMADRPVKIQVSMQGSSLQVAVSNRVNHHLQSQADNLMMDLFKKRLQHCYPEKHMLLCNSNSATFKVTLQLRP